MKIKPKKILIVSSYAPPSLGGPQNLYNLFRDADPKSYFILTSFYAIDNLSAKIGTWLKGEYIFYDITSNKKNIAEVSNPSKSEVRKRSFVSRLKHFIKRYTITQKLIGILIILTPITAIVIKGGRVIKEKKITSIVTISDYGPAMIGGYILHQITRKDYTIFLFDLYKGNALPSPGNFLASFFEPHMFRAAKNIIVTNEGTREFYIKRYGPSISKKITIIHNATFQEPYQKLEKPYTLKSPYTIMFTGRIYWPQLGALKNLIQAVNELKKSELELKLEIYSPSPKDYLKELGIVESEKVKIDVASPAQMPEIQNRADILFLPLSWNTESQAIIDTATPGKLTDYLIAGKPILIHAPASSFVARYAKENKFAVVVDEDSVEKLKRAIKDMLANEELLKIMIDNAKKTFVKNHDANKNAELFASVLNS